MEIQEILSAGAQVIGMLFVVGLGTILIWSMTRDGTLTANEASTVVIMVGFIYAIISNGSRLPDTAPIFDSSIILILLGSVLAMAGLDAYTLIQGKKNNKPNQGLT